MLKTILDAVRMAEIRHKRRELCCRMPFNLTQHDSGRPDVLIERCRCGRRHYVLRADPGVLGTTGSPVGKSVDAPKGG